MASPSLIEYYITLAGEHRAKAALAEGAKRLHHRSQVDQYERLAGLRSLFTPAT